MAKLFRVYEKESRLEVTDDFCIDADGRLVAKDYPYTPDENFYHFEWIGPKAAMGNGSWESYNRITGFITKK